MDYENRFQKIEEKIDSLEKRLMNAEYTIKEITEKLDKIESNTNRIIWLIISVVVLALLNSIIKGGVIA